MHQKETNTFSKGISKKNSFHQSSSSMARSQMNFSKHIKQETGIVIMWQEVLCVFKVILLCYYLNDLRAKTDSANLKLKNKKLLRYEELNICIKLLLGFDLDANFLTDCNLFSCGDFHKIRHGNGVVKLSWRNPLSETSDLGSICKKNSKMSWECKKERQNFSYLFQPLLWMHPRQRTCNRFVHSFNF